MHCDWTDDTICGHFGEECAAPLNAIVPPLYLNSLHTFDCIEDFMGGAPANGEGQYIYGRLSNPTTHLLEQKLNALEQGGGALCFGSGMAAITSAALTCLSPGGHVIAVRNCYGPARRFFTDYLARKMGVETTFVKGHSVSEFEEAIRPNTQVIYLESPSSVVFELQDLRAVAALAKSRGIKTMIDNSWSTPLFQKPLLLGVDFSIHTMSKYIGGHSDIIGGAVVCASAEDHDRLRSQERELLGGILGPFDAWLAIRGLRTLPVRVKQHGQSAHAIAKRLESHPKVERVHYPGLDTCPQYELGKSQMSGYTGLLSFVPKGGMECACRMVNALSLFRRGVSWGGFESLAVMPMHGHTDESAQALGGAPNLVRLAIGLEDVEDLWRDIECGLKLL